MTFAVLVKFLFEAKVTSTRDMDDSVTPKCLAMCGRTVLERVTVQVS